MCGKIKNLIRKGGIDITKDRIHHVTCLVCGKKNIVCPDCNSLLQADTSFSRYLRSFKTGVLSSNFYDNQNLDYIWHRYPDPSWFITIEEKQYNGKSSFAQKDTHGIIMQLLKAGCEACDNIVVTEKGKKKKIEYRGHYIIVFEKTYPEDSEWIKINNRFSSTEDLLYLLENGSLPILTDSHKNSTVLL